MDVPRVLARVYRRMGTAEHTVWIQKAAKADVDAIQPGNVPKFAADQDYAELFKAIQGTKTYKQDCSEALTNPAGSLPAIAARTKTPPLKLETPAPPAQPNPPSPLSRDNAVGRHVDVLVCQKASTQSTRAPSMKGPAGKASSYQRQDLYSAHLPTLRRDIVRSALVWLSFTRIWGVSYMSTDKKTAAFLP